MSFQIAIEIKSKYKIKFLRVKSYSISLKFTFKAYDLVKESF